MKARYVKREEAEARQKRHNALSTKQKLELIASRRGKSKKERAKLKDKLAQSLEDNKPKEELLPEEVIEHDFER